jgi:hypothetical protein
MNENDRDDGVIYFGEEERRRIEDVARYHAARRRRQRITRLQQAGVWLSCGLELAAWVVVLVAFMMIAREVLAPMVPGWFYSLVVLSGGTMLGSYGARRVWQASVMAREIATE